MSPSIGVLAAIATLAAASLPPAGAPATSGDAVGDAVGDADLDAVEAALLALVLSGDPAENNQCNVSGAHGFAQSLPPSGAWPDVNYTDRTRTGAWQPEIHLRRQLAMAIAARETLQAANRTDAVLVAAVHRSLAFWFSGDAPNGTTFPFGFIHSANWFTGEIWDNAVLGNTALAFEPWLTAVERHTIVEIMMRANWQKYVTTDPLSLVAWLGLGMSP